MLEPVEVDHHHRAVAPSRLEGGQRRIELVRHAVAVAEPGERIVAREAGGLLLAGIVVGDVDAGAAEAREATITGRDRLAGEAQHRALGQPRRTHRHAGEGFVCAEHQGERLAAPLTVGGDEDRR